MTSPRKTDSSFSPVVLRAAIVLMCVPAMLFTAPAQAQDPIPTATALTLTAGGATVTSVANGTVVTLTATVKAGSTPVTQGMVNFCVIAKAATCTDVHLVGTSHLTPSGTAILKVRAGDGKHPYKAVYAGTSSFAASSSGSRTLVVTGPTPTSTAIAATGSQGDYTLTATVTGVAPSAPSGEVSFIETTDATTLVARAALDAQPPGLDFALAQTVPTLYANDTVGPVYVTDLNGDGFPDVVALAQPGPEAYQEPAAIYVILGNGDGQFSVSKIATPALAGGPQWMATGDFNGDGKPDLILGYYGNASTILETYLGKGNGTFDAPISSTLSSDLAFFGAGDFNKDGFDDLATISGPKTSNPVLTTLLSKGDGTFTSVTQPIAYNNPQLPAVLTSVVGDFNGDGIPDLAMTGQNLAVFLGKGNGTFTVVTPVPLGFTPAGLAAADFNEDGKLDLAVANYLNAGIMVYTGNGNGTFKAPASVAGEFAYPNAIAVGDFNGDGIADLIAVDDHGNNTNELTTVPGRGDGTFGGSVVTAAPFGRSIATADFNGDGTSDLALGNFGPHPSVTTLLAETQLSTATATGVSPAGAGNHAVQATYPGDSENEPSASGTVSIVGRSVPSVSVKASAATRTYGQTETFTATVTGSGATPTGTVSFYDGSTRLGSAALSSGSGSLSTTALTATSHSITAQYSGDTNYGPATSPAITVTVNKATPTVTLKSSAASAMIQTPVTFTATVTGTVSAAPQGLVVFYDGATELGYGKLSSSGVATYITSALKAGTHSITAEYTGGSNYTAKTSAPLTETITAP